MNWENILKVQTGHASLLLLKTACITMTETTTKTGDYIQWLAFIKGINTSGVTAAGAIVQLDRCSWDNVELDGDGGDGNGPQSIWLSDFGTIDSKHSETGVHVDIVRDIGDGSRTLDSDFFSFFEGRLSKSSSMFCVILSYSVVIYFLQSQQK